MYTTTWNENHGEVWSGLFSFFISYASETPVPPIFNDTEFQEVFLAQILKDRTEAMGGKMARRGNV